MNKTAKKAARKTCSALMLVVLAFLTTLPIFWCIITSLKTPQDISAYPPKVFNFTVTWNNYKQVFAQSFLQTAWNSVVYSLLTPATDRTYRDVVLLTVAKNFVGMSCHFHAVVIVVTAKLHRVKSERSHILEAAFIPSVDNTKFHFGSPFGSL